ncbi:hypothetical protein Tco_0628294 [Tanacetum coccineum]|uniref:Uncharacterized protein n=1 Tax=Tanacetum coccineum TaxID=301880 RepID=A0ABQ4WPW5_9ASTR
MRLCDSWDEIVNRVRSRLSAWRAKSLSIGGRLTLVKWKSMLLDPDKGGLGIGSIHAKNLGLLGKWKWRFLTEFKGPRLTPPYLVEFRGSAYGCLSRLFALDSSQDCSVSDRWQMVDGLWMGNWNWRIQPRGRSLGDLDSLISLLGNMSLSPVGVDIWQWNFESYGKFKVSTLSKSIQNLVLADDVIGLTHNWNDWIP